MAGRSKCADDVVDPIVDVARQSEPDLCRYGDAGSDFVEIALQPEELAGVREEGLPCGSDADPSRVPIEEADAETNLQPLDALGEWRLRHAEVASGIAEVPRVGHCSEESQMAKQIH